ncbi:hypothetical protein AAMO2058_000679800 [Amorphochlora amoebiformis]
MPSFGKEVSRVHSQAITTAECANFRAESTNLVTVAFNFALYSSIPRGQSVIRLTDDAPNSVTPYSISDATGQLDSGTFSFVGFCPASSSEFNIFFIGPQNTLPFAGTVLTFFLPPGNQRCNSFGKKIRVFWVNIARSSGTYLHTNLRNSSSSSLSSPVTFNIFNEATYQDADFSSSLTLYTHITFMSTAGFQSCFVCSITATSSAAKGAVWIVFYGTDTNPVVGIRTRMSVPQFSTSCTPTLTCLSSSSPTTFPTPPVLSPTPFPVSNHPTPFPSFVSNHPTPFPSPATNHPTPFPSQPSPFPTPFPLQFPTPFPTPFPSPYPTPFPTPFPSPYPTPFPTPFPSPYPTPFPTTFPSPFPTRFPTPFPSRFPTFFPTPFPSRYPTSFPTPFPVFPTSFPTRYPTPPPQTQGDAFPIFTCGLLYGDLFPNSGSHRVVCSTLGPCTSAVWGCPLDGGSIHNDSSICTAARMLAIADGQPFTLHYTGSVGPVSSCTANDVTSLPFPLGWEHSFRIEEDGKPPGNNGPSAAAIAGGVVGGIVVVGGALAVIFYLTKRRPTHTVAREKTEQKGEMNGTQLDVMGNRNCVPINPNISVTPFSNTNNKGYPPATSSVSSNLPGVYPPGGPGAPINLTMGQALDAPGIPSNIVRDDIPPVPAYLVPPVPPTGAMPPEYYERNNNQENVPEVLVVAENEPVGLNVNGLPM